MPNIINEVVVNGNTYGLPGSGTLSNLATIESDASAASKAYAVGDHLVLNDVYYAVTAAIAQNDALLVGTNISVAKAGDEIKQINNDLSGLSFRDNNGKLEYSANGGITWQKIGENSKPDLTKPVTITSGTAIGKDCFVVIGASSGAASGNISVNGTPLGSYAVAQVSSWGGGFRGMSSLTLDAKSTDKFIFTNYTVVGFEYL